MSDRLDRIELLLENLATSQQTTQQQIDATQHQLETTQHQLETTQRQLESVILRVDSLAENSADLRTRQVITQHQAESNAALSADIRLATAALLQAVVRHDARLERLEQTPE